MKFTEKELRTMDAELSAAAPYLAAPVVVQMRGLIRDLLQAKEAASALYYAAHWTPDRPVEAGALWTAFRDAMGFEPGNAPAPTEAQS